MLLKEHIVHHKYSTRFNEKFCRLLVTISLHKIFSVVEICACNQAKRRTLIVFGCNTQRWLWCVFYLIHLQKAICVMENNIRKLEIQRRKTELINK